MTSNPAEAKGRLLLGPFTPHRRGFAVLLLVIPTWTAAATETQDFAFFEENIRPVLVEHCYSCHSQQAETLEGGLLLDSRAGTRAGGDMGPAVVPGDPEKSLLMQALEYQELEMPPDGRLSAKVIADFKKWISAGAPDPRVEAVAIPQEPDYTEAREFWAFQPVAKTTLPRIKDRSWTKTPIDYFILKKLEGNQLRPAPEARRRQLVRRLYFDLLGLPPTPVEVELFVSDHSPDAYERLVDRLLASPRYGERWGQHWLDLVRYAETEGFEYDRLLPGAWRYRDYVIESLNTDKPYDRFVTEQLAGDEIDPADATLRVAAGLHRLGAVRRNAGNQKVASSRNEVLTERTDIIGLAFLGLTVGCARCHDHKFDPIPQRDYYRLQAYLAATQEDNVIVAAAEQKQRWQELTDQIDGVIKQAKDSLANASGDEKRQLEHRIQELEAQRPPPLPTLCSIVNDPQNAMPIHVLRRGNAELPGMQVGMRPLGVLSPDELVELTPITPRPRTQLARWLTDPSHPLTARVMVNRIWQHHFGQGLVATANDFGQNGTRPSHPELLDYLARSFVANGWQWKPLHRMILLSSTYRQATTSPHAELGQQLDPDNRLLWRFSRRRLSAEEIRDAMLAVSDRLNTRAGGHGILLPVDQELIDQLYAPSQWSITADASQHGRRSIYLLAKRNLRLPFMEVFDQPAAQTSCPDREQSTHAPQALELLNGRLVNELAEALAVRLRHEAGVNPAEQVAWAYRLAAGRPPTARERQLGADFISAVSLREFALAMFNLNAFLYVD